MSDRRFRVLGQLDFLEYQPAHKFVLTGSLASAPQSVRSRALRSYRRRLFSLLFAHDLFGKPASTADQVRGKLRALERPGPVLIRG